MNVKYIYYLACLLAVALLGNCTVIGVTDSPADAGDFSEDATIVDDRLRCGAEPYVLATIKVTTTVGDPLPGITFTSPMCPGVTQLSDDNGIIEGYVTKNATFYARFDADAYASVLSSEQKYKADNTVTVPMLPRFITGVLPNYDPKRGAILISLPKNPKVPDPCSDTDGVRLTVKNVPSARILYFAEGLIPTVMDGAKETSKAGFAAVLDLDLGEPVTIVGKKKGCSVSFTELGATGRAPLEANRITLMAGSVLPPLPVDGGLDAEGDAEADANVDTDASMDGNVAIDGTVDGTFSDADDATVNVVDGDTQESAAADLDAGAPPDGAFADVASLDAAATPDAAPAAD